MLNKSRNIIKKLSTGALLAGLAFSASAQNKTVGAVASAVASNLKALTQLITGIAYVGGTGMFLVAIFQFRQHKENPTQVPLSKPMMFLAIAAALVFLPSIINISGQTVFGTSTAGGASGFLPG